MNVSSFAAKFISRFKIKDIIFLVFQISDTCKKRAHLAYELVKASCRQRGQMVKASFLRRP